MTTVHPFMVALPAIGLLWCVILSYVSSRELVAWLRAIAEWRHYTEFKMVWLPRPLFPALMLGMLLTALVAAALCVSAINWILAFT